MSCDLRLIEEEHLALAADPTESWTPPPPREPVPHLDFSPLLNARDRMARAARALEDVLSEGRVHELDPATVADLEDR